MLLHHYIITRFNIKQSFGCQPRNPEKNLLYKNLENTYLTNRFEIFEKFTFPSIYQQTNQNFTWLLLFHKQTPEEFKKRMMKWKEAMPQIQLLFFEDNEKFAIEDYRKAVGEDTDMAYITSRIDNDDAYHLTYIEKIQDYIQTMDQVKPCILSFEKGMQYAVDTQKLYAYSYLENHFTSMISTKGSQYQFVYQINHARVLEHAEEIELKCIKEELPMWLEIVHDTNYINRIKSEKEDWIPEEDSKKILMDFGITP